MSDNCFYKMLGEEFGPVSVEDLRELVRSGQLDGNDEVRMDQGRPWQAVSQVAELKEGGHADRFTPQRTRGLFSSVSESVAGSSSGTDSNSAGLDEFHDLSELMIDGGDTAPRRPAATPKPSARPDPIAERLAARSATPSGPATTPTRPTPPKPAAPATQPQPNGRPGATAPANRTPATPSRPAPAPVPRMPVAAVPMVPVPVAPIPVSPVPMAPAPVMPTANMGYGGAAGVVTAPVPQEMQWYCWTNNQQYGPVTIETLVEWARGGRLTPKDHVKFGENGEWFDAGTVEELFATPKKEVGRGATEIKVQSREEFQHEKEVLAASAPAPVEAKKDAEKNQLKLEPLFTKDMLKRVTEKKSSGGGMQINLSKNAQLGILLGVLAVIGGAVYLPSAGINIGKLFGGGNAWEMGIYQKLRGHHTKLKDFRSKKDSAGWEKYAKDVQSEIDGYRKSLEKSAGAKYPARQQLLFAVKDHWKVMVSDSATAAGPGEEQFDKALATARKLLQKK